MRPAAMPGIGTIKNLLLDPTPLQTLSRRVIRRFELGTYEQRLRVGAVDRPHYGHIVYNAASLAARLGYPRISVLEFGVAGGAGLTSLERHAEEVSRIFPVEIEIYGFDTGEGLPEPVDYRDLPYHWKRGFFRMDPSRLKSTLKRAHLVLGNVEQTAQTFFRDHAPAPVGAVVHDMDFYSSTAAALRLFDQGHDHFLPRVFCYFDDIIGAEVELYSEYTGQRLAIEEFNREHPRMKLSLPYYLTTRKGAEPWMHQIRICHFFDHPKYNQFVSLENQQLPLGA